MFEQMINLRVSRDVFAAASQRCTPDGSKDAGRDVFGVRLLRRTRFPCVLVGNVTPSFDLPRRGAWWLSEQVRSESGTHGPNTNA